MNKVRFLLFAAFCGSAAGAMADENTLVASRVFDRSLSDVRAALQSFCFPTNSSSRAWKTNSTPGTNGSASKDALKSSQAENAPGASFTVWLTDCTPPQPRAGIVERLAVKTGRRKPRPFVSYWQGKIVATSLSGRQTRFEIFQQAPQPNAAAMADAYESAVLKTLHALK